MITEINEEILTIKQALEEFAAEQPTPVGAAFQQAFYDCLAYTNFPMVGMESVALLEQYFDNCLWFADDVGFDEAYPTEVEKNYAIALGSIEEYLVYKGLIYVEIWQG